MADRKSPKGVPLLSLKLSTPVVPQGAMTPSQASFAVAGEVPWTGNVGARHYFLGNPEAEGLSDEDLYRLFKQKEGEIFAAKNSRTPFQYMISPADTHQKLDDKVSKEPEPLQRVKDDSRDASYEAWAAQMTSLMLLRKEEQKSKQAQQ